MKEEERLPARTRTLSPEALDFAPGLLSIQESPPARLPRGVLYAVSLLFAILLAWAVYGELDILAAAVAQAEKQLSEVASRYRSELQNERVEAEGEYRRLQQESVKLAHKAELLELKASQTGIVKDLATHTIGAVVSPGTVVLTLVPENEPLVAEVMIKNDDVGFVHAQQPVKVKLAAYPFQKYGMLDGEVIHVGPDASEGENPAQGSKDSDGAEQPPARLTYKALITLKAQTLEARGKVLKLVPGMRVVAEIHQGRRTVMEYLLSPVQKILHEGGRER
jgi:HlyD family secretion protein